MRVRSGVRRTASNKTPLATGIGCTGRRKLPIKKEAPMRYRTPVAAAVALIAAGLATAAPPKVVTAPNSDPQCFAPWAANTKQIGRAHV